MLKEQNWPANRLSRADFAVLLQLYMSGALSQSRTNMVKW